jgi:hypothetical protein
MSALVFQVCVAAGVFSWFLGAFFYLCAYRDYRGPAGVSRLLSPFAIWDPLNYQGAGAHRIRRSLLCFIVFAVLVGLAALVGLLGRVG